MTIEGLCIALYNISLNMECGQNRRGDSICVCPNKESMEYLAYIFCKKYGFPGEKTYRLSLSKSNGGYILNPGLAHLEICRNPRWENSSVINMERDRAYALDKLADLHKLRREQQVGVINYVDLVQTITVIDEERRKGLRDIVCAYDADLLMETFWNLTYNLLESIAEGKDNPKLFDRLIDFFCHLNEIFDNRELIFDQFRDFCRHICMGLEEDDVGIVINDTLKLEICKLMEEHINYASLPGFLWGEGEKTHFYKHAFMELAAIVKVFLERSAMFKNTWDKERVDSLSGYLAQLYEKEPDIKAIKGLENISLSSDKAVRADANLILQYMRRLSKPNCIERYERIA